MDNKVNDLENFLNEYQLISFEKIEDANKVLKEKEEDDCTINSIKVLNNLSIADEKKLNKKIKHDQHKGNFIIDLNTVEIDKRILEGFDTGTPFTYFISSKYKIQKSNIIRLGSEPGNYKTTLTILENLKLINNPVNDEIFETDKRCIFVSAEMDIVKLKLYTEDMMQLHKKNYKYKMEYLIISFLDENYPEDFLEYLEMSIKDYQIVIIDSETSLIHDYLIHRFKGSVKRATSWLYSLMKKLKNNEPHPIFFLINHVNKDGNITGRMGDAHNADIEFYIKKDKATNQCVLTYTDPGTKGAKNRISQQDHNLSFAFFNEDINYDLRKFEESKDARKKEQEIIRQQRIFEDQIKESSKTAMDDFIYQQNKRLEELEKPKVNINNNN